MQLLKKLSYLPLLITLFCFFPLRGDEFTDFAQTLEHIQPSILSIEEKQNEEGQKESVKPLEKSEKKDFEAAPGLPAVRVIVQSDDKTLLHRDTLTGFLKKLNKDSDFKLFRIVNTADYDNAKEYLKKDFQINKGYKTILVAGWKPIISSTSSQWTPSPVLFHKETSDKTVHNYFGDFEATPKDKSAILIMLVLLSTKENRLATKNKSLEEKLQHDTFSYTLEQSFNGRSQEDLFGTITLASAIFKDNQLSDLTLYSVDPAGQDSAEKLGITLQDWLKLPLVPAKEIPQKISKKEAKKTVLTPWEINAKQWEIQQQLEEQEALKKRENWLKGFEEAENFTYSQKPKIRLIYNKGEEEAVQKIENYLNTYKQSFTGPIEKVVDYGQLLDLLDGTYKNIFVRGWTEDKHKSVIFFRSDGFFNHYSETNKFSPNTTLVLIVPLNTDSVKMFEDGVLQQGTLYGYDGMHSTSLNSNYVVIGQSVSHYNKPNIKFPIIKRDGSFSTVADWLTWGVDLSGKKPSQKQEIKKLEQKKEPTKQLKKPKEQPKPSTSSKKLSPEEQEKIDWEKGLEKALTFKYKKTPQVRIIISTELKQAEDQKTVKEKITKFLKGKKLIDPKNIVFVNYDEKHDPINLLDGKYKNIFLIGLNGESGQSQLFFREVYFGAEQQKPANEFSPITTLLLIMPLNEKVRASYFKLKACYSYDLMQSMVGTWNHRTTVCDDKYVAVGQTEPFSQAPNIDEPVLKPDGSITSFADWLTWGVPQ